MSLFVSIFLAGLSKQVETEAGPSVSGIEVDVYGQADETEHSSSGFGDLTAVDSEDPAAAPSSETLAAPLALTKNQRKKLKKKQKKGRADNLDTVG